jgi:hypothetical protein
MRVPDEVALRQYDAPRLTSILRVRIFGPRVARVDTRRISKFVLIEQLIAKPVTREEYTPTSRRKRCRRMMPLERTGAFTLACAAVLLLVAVVMALLSLG